MRTHVRNENGFYMKNALKGALALCLILSFTISATGQTPTTSPDGRVNTIITSVPFLRIVPDARSGAMGDVGIAISPDANAMHFNASKLVFSEHDFGIAATYTPWLRALGLNDVYMAYLSGYKKIDELQAIGASIRFFSLGSIQFTDEQGQPLGSDNPNEFEIKASYARKLSDNFSAAAGLKFVYSRLANGQTVSGQTITPGTAVAGDISFTFDKDISIANRDAHITVGTAVTNIGTKISYTKSVYKDFIPTNLGIGTALTYNFDDYNSLSLAVDVNKLLVPTPTDVDEDPNDGIPDYKDKSSIAGIFSSFGDAPGGFSEEMSEFNYAVGLEYWYDKQFAVRLGHFNEHRNKGNRKFLTVGVGVKYSVFGLDFAYLVPTSNQRNPLDNTLRFTLMFDFAEGDSVSGGKKKDL